MIQILKKALILTSIITLVMPAYLSPVALFKPEKAEAIAVVVTGAPTIEKLLAIIAKATTAETAKTFEEWAWRFVRETIRKRLLDTIADQIIGWINGEGDPKFVTDWGSFIEEAAGIAAADLVKELGAGFLCQPFSAQVQIALAPVQRFKNSITCTLDDITSNIQNFYNDFNDGGWIAYTESWSPQNNLWGAYLIATDEQSRREAKAIYAADKEATVGGGFLSTKSCEEFGDTSDPASGADIDRDKKYGDVASTCRITTPGSVIAHLANQAIGVDIPYLLSAEEFEAYLGAIANALFNRLIRTGVEGLQGVTSNSSPGADFVANAQNVCAQLTGAAKTACEEYVVIRRGNFTTAREQLQLSIDLALSARREGQGIIDGTVVLAQKHQNFLISANTTRDACVSEADLADAAATLAGVQSRATINTAFIATLEQERAKALALGIDDWARFAEISANTINSPAVQLAEDFRNAATLERDALFAGSFNPDVPTGRFIIKQQEVTNCSGVRP